MRPPDSRRTSSAICVSHLASTWELSHPEHSHASNFRMTLTGKVALWTSNMTANHSSAKLYEPGSVCICTWSYQRSETATTSDFAVWPPFYPHKTHPAPHRHSRSPHTYSSSVSCWAHRGSSDRTSLYGRYLRRLACDLSYSVGVFGWRSQWLSCRIEFAENRRWIICLNPRPRLTPALFRTSGCYVRALSHVPCPSLPPSASFFTFHLG